VVEVKPFRAYYYNVSATGDLGKQLAPPYDVISEKGRDELYSKSMFNAVRLILGRAEAGDSEKNNRFTRAHDYLGQFIKAGKLIQSRKPAIYIYSIEFEFRGKLFTRLGVVALVRLADFSAKKILPHEMTFKKVSEEQLALLRECRANFWPVFGFYRGNHRVQDIIKKYVSGKSLLFFQVRIE
jgi:uncharacterized protein (DUF1015 family)